MSQKDLVLIISMIFIGIALTLILIRIFYCTLEQQSVVLILTAGVVVWYAWETRKLKQVMIEQKDIGIMPVLMADWSPGKAMDLKNIGNFPAYRVRFHDIKVKRSIDTPSESLVFGFFDILLPSDKGAEIVCAGKRLTPDVVTEYGLFNYTTAIEYENIFGVKYEAEVIFRKDGLIRIMGAKRNNGKGCETRKI
jgi:hypothetical protein